MCINCVFHKSIFFNSFSSLLFNVQHGNKPQFDLRFLFLAKLMFVLTDVCIQVFKLFAEIFQPNRIFSLRQTTNHYFMIIPVLLIPLFRASILPEETRGHSSCGWYRHHSLLSGEKTVCNPVHCPVSTISFLAFSDCGQLSSKNSSKKRRKFAMIPPPFPGLCNKCLTD